MNTNISPELKRVAFIGNYLPRKCGIATFTSDLVESFSEQFPEIQTKTLAMNDTEQGYAYPSQVRYEISQDDRFDRKWKPAVSPNCSRARKTASMESLLSGALRGAAPGLRGAREI